MRADLRQDDFLIVFDPDECPAATEEQRQQLLASLDRVVACFESLIEALTDDVESTNRTLSFLNEAYEASAKYRAA